VSEQSGERERSAPKYRILVVDDEPAVLDLMVEVLEGRGFEVVGLTSPVDALKKAKLHKFDAAVVDVYMPEMSGLLFHAKLKLADPALAARTVFVSGHVKLDDLRRHLESLPTFVAKPFDVEDFVRTVKKVLPATPRQQMSP
jgi:CheY-like chemotaxis protein